MKWWNNLSNTKCVVCKFEKNENFFCVGQKDQAVSLFCDCNHYFLAGRIRRWIAEMKEEKGEIGMAIDEYQKASKLLDAEGGPILPVSTSCLERAAYLMGEQKRYIEAATLYETVGRRYLDENLTKYSAKLFFFRSLLLRLVAVAANHNHTNDRMDFSDCITHMKQIQTEDCRFEDSAHCDFLWNLMTIQQTQNVDDFADHVYDFDALYKLDDWSLELLQVFFPLEGIINDNDDDDDDDDV